MIYAFVMLLMIEFMNLSDKIANGSFIPEEYVWECIRMSVYKRIPILAFVSVPHVNLINRGHL